MTNRIHRVLTATVATLVGLAGTACQPGAETPAVDPAETTVTGGEPFHGVLEYRARDAKLALVRPTFVSAADAGIADGVSVVGVFANDEARAYPLYVLKNHQIVNDTLGDLPIAASW